MTSSSFNKVATLGLCIGFLIILGALVYYYIILPERKKDFDTTDLPSKLKDYPYVKVERDPYNAAQCVNRFYEFDEDKNWYNATGAPARTIRFNPVNTQKMSCYDAENCGENCNTYVDFPTDTMKASASGDIVQFENDAFSLKFSKVKMS